MIKLINHIVNILFNVIKNVKYKSKNLLINKVISIINILYFLNEKCNICLYNQM